jgi:hypothetical protein
LYGLRNFFLKLSQGYGKLETEKDFTKVTIGSLARKNPGFPNYREPCPKKSGLS